MALLTKDQIVAASDIRTETVPVPEWGGEVAVREMTGTERDAFEQSLVRTKPDGSREPDLSNMRAKLVAACLVDGVTGDPLFTPAQIGELANKSARALDRIFRVAQTLNGMNDVDAAVGNSAAAPSGASTSV